ncbi:MAG: carbohydrate kinase [Succinivibrio sp.]
MEVQSGAPLCAGVGEILFDVIGGVPRLGGAPGNFAYMCSQLGFRSCPVAAVGRDALGDRAVSELKAAGLDTSFIERSARPTGTVEVRVDARGVPSYEFLKDCAYDHLEWNEKLASLARGCAIACFGTLCQRAQGAGETVRRFAREAKGAGAITVYDVNLRQSFYSAQVIRESQKLARIVKCNDEELPVLASLMGAKDDPRSYFEWLAGECGCAMLVLTRGAHGSAVYSKEETSELPGKAVRVADTVGAGDAFTAVLCCSLFKGMSLEEAHRLAASAASAVCSQSGAMVPLPKEVKAALNGR